MDLEEVTTNRLSNDDVLFLEKVMIDVRSYADILNTTVEKKEILLFPPVNNFRRFLVHQLVEKSFSGQNLSTLSIGRLYARRTVVYPAHLKLSSQEKGVESGCQNTFKPVIARSPALKSNSSTMSSITDSRTRRGRKPDMQIYVPRGRRMLDANRRDQPAEPFVENEIHSKNDFDEGRTPEIKLHTSENWDTELKNPTATEQVSSVDNLIVPDTPENSNVNNDKRSTVFDTPRMQSTKSEVEENALEDWKVENEDSSVIVSSMSEKNPQDQEFTSNVSEIQGTIREDGSMMELNVTNISNDKAEENIVNASLCVQKQEDVNLNKRSHLSKIDKISDKTMNNDVNYIAKNTNNTCNSLLNAEMISGSNLGNGLSEPNLADALTSKTIEAQTDSKESGLIASSMKSSPNTSSSTPKTKNGSLKASECDWEELFDDSGVFVDDSLVEELMKSVGKVKIQHATQDYRPYQTCDERSSDGECIIEVYDFPSDFKTDDLIAVFASYRSDQGFQIIWVDDTHALAVFSSPIIADEVLNGGLPCVKTRPLKNAIPKSKMKAREFVPATATRPKTCVSLARRLVSGHLGMKIKVTDKQREAERKLLSDAREKRRLVAKQKCDVWDSTPTSERWT